MSDKVNFIRYGLDPHSSRHGGGHKNHTDPGSTCPPGYELKPSVAGLSGGMPECERVDGSKKTARLCDDNPVLMQLARLYVVSPERIVLLLAQPSLTESCAEISDVLDNIRNSMRNCVLAPDNIYGRLAEGLSYFQSEVCVGDDSSNRKRCTGLQESHNCLKELRTDMIECEAPADWYERRNASKVCHIFNDVLNCYYTRAALLCGLEVARQLRSFAGDSMGRAMIHKCEVSKRLPRVDNAMPINASSRASLSILRVISSWIFVIYFSGIKYIF
ncbi:GM18653 [Drosophila sechellia]|uniref:GD24039 n=2 Tax=melanogaster subgroup TaxID=32351 RepID=B4Q6Y1_DROSI|nr:GM18653 [Drosophila sechellia]EDX05189.1 GD24039 [Drosophila simulans]